MTERFRLIFVHLLLLAACCAESAPRQHKPPQQANQQQANQSKTYFGQPLGKLRGRQHNVSGEVFAVDEQTIFLRQFSYDGRAPDAYFWSSVTSGSPAADGFIVPDEKGSTKPLERYQDRDLVLRLPEGKTLREIQWLCVWSRQLSQNLGEIIINKQLPIPRPLEIEPLSQLAHGLGSGPITIVDAQTLLVPDFRYDGQAPEAYFWLSRGGQGLQARGLRLKDENGGSGALRKYQGETVVVSLPDEMTIHDFDYFGVWCKKFNVNFGHSQLPAGAKVPPSPKMLGIKPENKLNCEILYDELGYEIRWVLDGDDIVMQLVGKIEPNEYMAFGLGKDDSKSEMENADAAVAWVERQTGQVHAVDYFLGKKQQCKLDSATNNFTGSCPDAKLRGGSDSLTLLHGAIVNGYSMVTFKRPQLGVDEQFDQHVYSDGQQSVLWAIGSLNANQELGYHRLRTKGNMFIDFARNPQWNCPVPDLNASMQQQQNSTQEEPSLPVAAASQLDASLAPANQLDKKPEPNKGPAEGTGSEPWFIPSVVCPSDRTFYAQIGPTGGRRGYQAITGRSSWQNPLSWYINGLMVPELVMERGKSYLFVVEGGNDKTQAASRHPLYLTDSPDGGFHFKTDDERLKERIFAGVALRGDGQLLSTAEGRLCQWKATNQTHPNADLYPTFASYQRSLRLDCLPGQASVMPFAPDQNTPDLIYYQCYTHRNMGWRVRIVDSCSAYMSGLQAAASQWMSNTTNNNNTDADGESMAKLKVTRRRRKHQRRMLANKQRRPTYDRRASAESSFPFGLPQQTNSNADLFDGLPSFHNFLDSSDYLLNSSSSPVAYQATSLDELLRLSPAELEFIDAHAEAPFAEEQHQFLMSQQAPLWSATATSSMQPNQTNAAKTPPKTLHSYMRRLASMYLPVQLQLATLLSQQQQQQQVATTTGKPLQLMQPAASSLSQLVAPATGSQKQVAEQQTSSGFSLSNLVPTKSKLEQSKSNLQKKFNKFRFKSDKQKPAIEANKVSQPPTPATEFNYDIFNNQLAQLEKQQKQMQQNVDFMASDSINLNLMPAMMQQQQQPTTMSSNSFPAEHSPGLRFPVRPGLVFGEPILASNEQFVDSYQLANTTSHALNGPSSWPPKAGWPNNPISQQQSIFISQYPTASGFQQPTSGSQAPLVWTTQSQLAPGNRRPPEVSPPRQAGPEEGQQQQQFGHALPAHGQKQAASSSLDTFVQQPPPAPFASSSNQIEPDHMLAIERYSKQSSDRRPPSALHPSMTGESLVLANQQAEAAKPQQANQQQPKRFSSMLIEKHLMAPGGQMEPMSSQNSDHLSNSTNQPQVLVRVQSSISTREPEQLPLVKGTAGSSLGPFFRANNPQGRHETVLKSTLVEPIHSTLIAPSSSQQLDLSQSMSVNQHQFDQTPFTPIELSSPLLYASPTSGQQSIFGQFEPMPSHHQQQQPRSEPPVRLASYLTQQLATRQNHEPQAKSQPSELIILRPAFIDSNRESQTYALHPEYYGHPKVGLSGIETSPLASNSLLETGDQQIGAVLPSARLANRQFERLSSLSSSPSTSMSVDPMQMAHTVHSYVKHSNSSEQLISGGSSSDQSSSQANSTQPKELDPAASIEALGNNVEIPRTPSPSIHESVRLNPGGDNANTLLRDNNTDNAILSHVMSLISSNAIPAPPMTVTSLDYFAPMGNQL